jgi:phage gp29-like protein
MFDPRIEMCNKPIETRISFKSMIGWAEKSEAAAMLFQALRLMYRSITLT